MGSNVALTLFHISNILTNKERSDLVSIVIIKSSISPVLSFFYGRPVLILLTSAHSRDNASEGILH